MIHKSLSWLSESLRSELIEMTVMMIHTKYILSVYRISQDWRKIHNNKNCSKPFIIKNPIIYLHIYIFCFVLKFFRFWGIFLRFYIYQLILATHNKTGVWLLSAKIIIGGNKNLLINLLQIYHVITDNQVICLLDVWPLYTVLSYLFIISI